MDNGFRNLEISNFRGINYLRINELSQVNVLVGANNVGKTSILEAAFMLVGMSNPMLSARVNTIRSSALVNLDSTRYIFHNLNFRDRPIIKADTCNGSRSLTIEPEFTNTLGKDSAGTVNQAAISRLIYSFEESGPQNIHQSAYLQADVMGNLMQTLPAAYVESMTGFFVSVQKNDADTSVNFAAAVKKNRKQQVVNALHNFDPSIENVEALPDGLYLRITGVPELLPVAMSGDGVLRVLNILSSVACDSYNVVFIDEIDNGLHYSAHKKLWNAILRFAVERGMQIFATTHNYESLQGLAAALDENPEMQSTAKVYNIADTKLKGYQAYGYTYPELNEAIIKELELRK